MYRSLGTNRESRITLQVYDHARYGRIGGIDPCILMCKDEIIHIMFLVHSSYARTILRTVQYETSYCSEVLAGPDRYRDLPIDRYANARTVHVST
jgi:hypothetical protein